MQRQAWQQVLNLRGAFQRGFSQAAGQFGQTAAADSSARSGTQAFWGRVSMGMALGAAGAFAAPAAFSSPASAVLDAPTTSQSAASQTTSQRATAQAQVVFVLGGPGSGKGTQCARLIEEYLDLAHFSAGDLLRAFVKSGSPEGNKVADMIKNGQIVPSEVTVGLLDNAITESGKPRVLIDGFPRNLENRDAFEREMGMDCAMVLFFDCPEEEMEKRLLSRNQGRVDDNIETIKKRFKVFVEQSMPVIDYYEKLGKVVRVRADRPPEVIFEEVKKYFAPDATGPLSASPSPPSSA